MLIFRKRKSRDPYSAENGRGEENRLDAAEAELDSLNMRIEEKLFDIKEESRDGRFKLPRSARRR